MKKEAIDFLVCPRCQHDLDLETDIVDGAEVMDGTLSCRSCSASYPIRGGIPRFVQGSSYADSFGYEWRRFRTVQLDPANVTNESEATFRAKTGWTVKDFRGALALDAGVGAGRFAEVASRWGASVVGVDLTSAVDEAFANIGRREGVHLVQADLLALPFRSETFDIAYSIGVLHHTADPQRAFQCVSNTVKNAGALAVYVYPALGIARHFSDQIRKVTTRLPLSVVYYFSALAVPLYYPYRLPVLGRFLQTLLPLSLHPNWRWRWLDTFDWYTPKYQWKLTYPEVFRWFRAQGYGDVEVLDFPICIRGVKRQGHA